MEIEKEKNIEKITLGILIAVLFITAFNAIQVSKLKDIGINSAGNSNINPTSGSATGSATLDVIPKGIPDIYGKELGVSFDDVSTSNAQKADSTIRKIGVLDQKISLSGDDLSRYIKITSKISCEYCCGTNSIINPDGTAACGCAHSYAMRGLAKYLIQNHNDEYSDDEILEELGKWKTLFFPGQITQKAQILKGKGVELNYINLASNKYRGIEQGSGSGNMVGGC